MSVGPCELAEEEDRSAGVGVGFSQGSDGPEVDGNLVSILSTSSRCLSWFSRLIRSFMASSWLNRLFCISRSWSISFCSRASSCACMAASISRSWLTVSFTSRDTWSMTVLFRFLATGTSFTGEREKLVSDRRATGLFTSLRWIIS